ncbi:hypothetical protein [uncultured Psychromonas sp.]|uniref:hypothetical protein n=1 Tax=uncultured Psychromonas sp. TaxID=173974 RepID=UPI0026070A5E|nr:hypothetical protein [uncultured Psychromonas sp.]
MPLAILKEIVTYLLKVKFFSLNFYSYPLQLHHFHLLPQCQRVKLQAATSSAVNAIKSTKAGCQASAKATQESTTSLDSMTTIVEINALNMQIAAAVEQQSVTSNEISHNMTMIQSRVIGLAKNDAETLNNSNEIKNNKTQLVKVVEHFKVK